MQLLILLILLFTFTASFIVGYGSMFVKHKDKTKIFNQSIIKQEVITQTVEKLKTSESWIVNFDRQQGADMPENVSFTAMTALVSGSNNSTSSILSGLYFPSITTPTNIGIVAPYYLEHKEYANKLGLIQTANLRYNYGQHESEEVQKDRYRREIINILATRIAAFKK